MTVRVELAGPFRHSPPSGGSPSRFDLTDATPQRIGAREDLLDCGTDYARLRVIVPRVNPHRLKRFARQRLEKHAGSDESARPADGDAFQRTIGPAPLAVDGNPVTRLLYERLDPDDAREVRQRMRASDEFMASGMDLDDPWLTQWLVLSWGVWLDVPAVVAKTGLVRAQPPDDVHAMARGPLAAAGGLYEADLVVDALASVGVDLKDARRALDFGCSSGRVVRVLQAAYPHVSWAAGDPNGPAIAWADAHLPGIEFFVSPQQPPLNVEYGSFDLVYAISIWSHFAPDLGMRWFDEMHRVLRPGGYLVITTHGFESVAYYASRGMRPYAQLEEIQRALVRSGSWYAPEFGPGGDWGVINQSWGTCFISPEWMLTRLCPLWRVLEFAPGRNQSNQDVYVLQRV